MPSLLQFLGLLYASILLVGAILLLKEAPPCPAGTVDTWAKAYLDGEREEEKRRQSEAAADPARPPSAWQRARAAVGLGPGSPVARGLG